MSIPVLLDEKPTVSVARPAIGRRAKGSLWRRSLELRASGAVGLRWQAVSAPQIVWNRSTRRAGARGDGAGWQAQMAEDLDDHRRIFDAMISPPSYQDVDYRDRI